ncbi:DUF421 domain-containing protein [Thomasclavelia sp.]|uniref:DUF421 domain-containing protein n=1 Tax=Thomasclavelia sp. TaxID=3025757 RepID=UPI0025FD2F9A|nr:YetF domain-containing protein [Thomasclavelia sp.]
MQLIELIIVPLISLIILFIITKLMGYRQVSQLNMYDYINGITIGSIASELALSGFKNLLPPLIAMLVYAIVIIGLSKMAGSSLKMRDIIDGHPVILYENNKIYNQELKKAKLDLDEFLMQCRINGYFDLSQLDTVILETNGTLSFNPKTQYRPTVLKDLKTKTNNEKLPVLLIKEGVILNENLKLINRDINWINHELTVLNLKLDKIILMYQQDNNNILVYSKNNIEKRYN